MYIHLMYKHNTAALIFVPHLLPQEEEYRKAVVKQEKQL